MNYERCDRQCQRPKQTPGKSYLTECYYPRTDRLRVGLTKAELHKKTPEGVYAGCIGARKNYRYVEWQWKVE